MQITDQKLVYDGYFKLRLLSLRDGDDHLKRERFEPGHSVAALVYDTGRERYQLVQQYRIGAEAEVLELPAGMLDKPGESAEAAMRREIEEELGYEVDLLEPIAEFYLSPGNSAEYQRVFYAEVSKRPKPGGGAADEGEKLTMVELTWEELLAYPYRDAKTLLAVQWAQLRRRQQ